MDEIHRRLIHIRFFKDEYRYNFRISKYCDEDNNVLGHCWLNIQPFNRDAVDMSIALNGEWDTYSEDNFFAVLDEGFDRLWEKYEFSEFDFKKNHEFS